MAYNVNIFTINGCSHCKILKEELTKENIKFNEFEVNEHKEVYDKILEKTKMDALPTVYLQNTDTGSGPLFVAGRDFNTKEEAIEKIKKYIN
jgi:glutaredoxin